MTCRHLPHNRDIVTIVGRHVDPCAKHWIPELDSRCSGCWPCPTDASRHCTVCANHLQPTEKQTCPSCRGDVRRALADVIEYAAQLPDQALHAARDGHLAAASAIPGEDALVLMARGSEGLHDDSPTEQLPPSFLLAWWEETWREAKGEDSRPPAWRIRPAAALVGAYGYLTRNLDWAAAYHPGFHWFARDMRRARGQLEELLHAGDQPPEGVPCFLCGTTLARVYRDPTPCDCGPRPHPGHDHGNTGTADPDRCCLGCARIIRWELRHATHDQGGLRDTGPFDGWSCPRCSRVYDPGEYQLAIGILHNEHAPALPASELADRLGLQPSLIWQWAHRGHVRKAGRAPDGRTLYDVADTLRHVANAAASSPSTKDVS